MKFIYLLIASLFLFASVSTLAQDEPEPVSLTGSWYDPAEPGHGIFIDEVAGVGTFVAWFTYNFSSEAPGQAWYVGYEAEGHDGTFAIARPQAEYPAVGYVQSDPIGRISIDRVDDNNILVVVRFIQEAPCVTPRVSPSPPWCDGSFELTRLLPAPPAD